MNTIEKLQEKLAAEPVKYGDFEGCEYKPPVKHMTMADGSTMSIQASEMHYCKPRENRGPYTQVEVYCCGEVAAWAEYGIGDQPYAYIPIELVAAEIERRGGLV